VAVSTGPQKAKYDTCRLDDQAQPTSSEYGGGTPKLAPQPKQLSLPVGRTDEEGTHKEKL
jgi:hypothetical protein